MSCQEIVSDEDWISWADVVELLPSHVASNVRENSTNKKSEVAAGEEWRNLDWLIEGWVALASSDSNQNIQDQEETELPDVNDEDLHTLWMARAELDEMGEHSCKDFDWILRGGKWTKRNKGCLYGCVACFAQTKEVANWCKHWCLTCGASFSTKLYGEDPALSLAEWWCARMHFFYSKHFEEGLDDTCKFSPEVLASWEEPADMESQFVIGCIKARKRITKIRRLMPVRRRTIT